MAQAGEFGFIVITLGHVERSHSTRLAQIHDGRRRHQHDADAAPGNRWPFDRALADRSSALSIATDMPPTTRPRMTDHVIIGGYGRVGQTIARLLQAENVPYIALDTNGELVGEHNKRGDNGVISAMPPGANSWNMPAQRKRAPLSSPSIRRERPNAWSRRREGSVRTRRCLRGRAIPRMRYG